MKTTKAFFVFNSKRHSLFGEYHGIAACNSITVKFKNHLSKRRKINRVDQSIDIYRRITKLVWIGSSMALSGEKTARVTWDDGLPVFSSQCFIWLILSSAPSISPLTVSSRVFRHQPAKPSKSACCLVYLRKNTPWTRPNTSNSHKNRDMSPSPFLATKPSRCSCFGNQTEFDGFR